jgi:patatin-like phospholipase/acyl hydrolase
VDRDRANLVAGATLFRSYKVPGDSFGGVSIVEAARATTAAPTFFRAKGIFDGEEDKYFV